MQANFYHGKDTQLHSIRFDICPIAFDAQSSNEDWSQTTTAQHSRATDTSSPIDLIKSTPCSTAANISFAAPNVLSAFVRARWT